MSRSGCSAYQQTLLDARKKIYLTEFVIMILDYLLVKQNLPRYFFNLELRRSSMPTQICTVCGLEIEENTSKCPRCGIVLTTKIEIIKRYIIKKPLLVACLILIVVGLLLSLFPAMEVISKGIISWGVLLGIIYVIYKSKKAKSPSSPITKVSQSLINKDVRKCLMCNYEGKMKTWLSNYNFPQFLAVVLLFFMIIPGLFFIAWGWGKYKCPRCGALAKNAQINQISSTQHKEVMKKCKFCAEDIREEAIKCRYCGSDVPANK